MKIRSLNIIKITLFLFLLNPLISNAQSALEDVVYLKNGSIIRGQIIEQKINKFVKIKCADRNIWVFQSSDIDSIKKETQPEIKKFETKSKGYVNNTDFGIMINRNGYFDVPINFLMVNAYKFPFNTTLGIGTGIESFVDPVIPLFLDAKYYVFDKKVSPFIILQTGYSFPFNKDTEEYQSKGGYLFNAGCGVRVFISKSSAWLFSLSYMYQELQTTKNYSWQSGTVITDYFINSLNIRVGFYFQ